jgi:hypothetical protein
MINLSLLLKGFLDPFLLRPLTPSILVHNGVLYNNRNPEEHGETRVSSHEKRVRGHAAFATWKGKRKKRAKII